MGLWFRGELKAYWANACLSGKALGRGYFKPEELFRGIIGLEHIVRIRLPVISIQDVGSVETESVPVIGADVWQAAGITGQGVKVGVLDRGFDGYRSLLGGDLPANVTVQSFIAGLDADQAGTVHGSAVAEIIHDIAPDAELYFAAYDTDVEQRQAIDWLHSQLDLDLRLDLDAVRLSDGV